MVIRNLQSWNQLRDLEYIKQGDSWFTQQGYPCYSRVSSIGPGRSASYFSVGVSEDTQEKLWNEETKKSPRLKPWCEMGLSPKACTVEVEHTKEH